MGLSAAEKKWIEGLNDKLENSLKESFGISVKAMQDTIADLQGENTRLRERLIQHDIALDDLEQYGRRHNVRVEGLTWTEGETNLDLEEKVIEAFGKQGVVVEPRDIIRLHRSSKAKDDNGVVTKQTIVKLATWRTREKFAGFNRNARAHEKATKTKVIRVNNDLTKRRLQLLSEARVQIKSRLLQSFSEEQIKKGLKDEDNVFAYANINSDLRIRARGRVISFNTLPELRAAIQSAFPDVPVVA